MATMLAAPSSAQQRDRDRPQTVLEVVEVNVVNVEVFVTDRDGEPVQGLTAADFVVKEDGNKVSLSNFTVVESQITGTGAEQETQSKGESPIAPPPAYVLFVIDNSTVDLEARRRLLESLRGRLEDGLARGFEYGVASYEGRIRMVQDFTRDPEQLIAAIEQLDSVTSRGVVRRVERQAELRNTLKRLGAILSPDTGSTEVIGAQQRVRSYSALMQEVNQYAEQIALDNRALYFGLAQLVNALAALPGRKALFFISEGIEMRPAADVYSLLAEAPFNSELSRESAIALRSDVAARSAQLSALGASASSGRRPGNKGKPTDDLSGVVALANSSRVSFYPVLPKFSPDGANVALEGNAAKLVTPKFERIRQMNLDESLDFMANETGGVSAAHSDLGGLLSRAERDVRSHYLLGFSPDHAGDGAFHKIKVNVKGRGHRVRYRSGYIDKTQASKLADQASAALLLRAGENPHDLTMDVGQAEPGEQKGVWIVPVTIRFSLERMTLLAQGESIVGASGYLAIAAENPDGGTVPVRTFDLPIELPKSKLDSGRGLLFSTEIRLALRKGYQRLAIGFSDPAAGLTSFVSQDLEVP